MRTWLRLVATVMIALGTLQCKKENNGETDINGTTSGPNSITSVAEEQNSLLIAYLGTWSGACAPAAAMLDSVSRDHLVQLNLHVGPSSLAPQYKDLDGVCKPAVFPLDAMAGLEQYPVPSVSVNCKKTETGPKQFLENAAATFAQIKPIANTACKVVSGATNGQLVIETRTSFFKADDGNNEYVLSLFIVEDDIEQTQSGSWDGFRNNHIIRAAVGGTLKNPVLYHSFVTGGISQGTSINRAFTFNYQDFGNAGKMNHWVWNPEKTSVVAVLCKRNNSGYSFVNVSIKKVTP
jgi:hypothetical protein